MFYVYAGSYKVESNAIEQGFELFKRGYDVIGVKFGNYTRLQVGAFKYKENCLHFIGELNSKGISAFYEYYEQTEDSVQWELKFLTQN